MFAVPREQVMRLHASSGTTGKPTVVGYTQNDIDMWANVMARSIHAAGGRPGDMLHNAYGYGLFTGGLGAHYGAERLGCTVIPMSGGQTEKQVQLIADFQPDIIMVTPSYMLTLADEFAPGHRPGATAAIGIFGAEPWTRRCARDRGAHERHRRVDMLRPVGSHRPRRRHGVHRDQGRPVIWEDHFYPGDHRPGTGEVLPDGEPRRAGHHHADQGSAADDPLPHARPDPPAAPHVAPMRRIDKITGRSDDMLIIRGVNVFPSQIEELILKQPHRRHRRHRALARQGPARDRQSATRVSADQSEPERAD
jgi:phenylacetate-CoA ligase